MTRRHVRIVAVDLSYGGGFALHTATSGIVQGLRELRLVVEQDGALVALGATRTNIAYLTGVAQAAVEAEILAAAAHLDWRAPWSGFAAAMDAALPGLSAPARMLFEMAARDGAAREAGVALSVWLGGPVADTTSTNQTLFWSDDATMLARAHAYVARGFRDLKLRIAVAGFEEDLRRLGLLREAFGGGVSLSADANGCWSAAEAPSRLEALARLGLDYVEQPRDPEAWRDTALLAAASPVPIMLDESLSDAATIDRLVATRAAPLAHLKLAKLGGLDRLMAAGRRLHQAGIGVMAGQMNEGSVSTLAVAHAAIALGCARRELYGADGLVDDPAGALRYDQGVLHLPPGPGLGLVAHPVAGSAVLWECRA